MTISSNFPSHFKDVFHKEIVTTTIMLCVNRTLDDEEVESEHTRKTQKLVLLKLTFVLNFVENEQGTIIF